MSTKKIIIFGTGKIAEVIYYYAVNECNLTVEAFCVDDQYMSANSFQSLPVVPFSNVEAVYPPSEFSMFVAVGYHDLNKLREQKCAEAIAKGYTLTSIISPLASIPSNVLFGWNCFIMSPAIIHPCVRIGNNVFIWNGAVVGHHSLIEDNCWLTSGSNISGNVRLGINTFVAINATVGHSVEIGRNCFLGANSLITKNLDDEKVVIVESTKTLRLTSAQFLRMSSFSNL